MARHCRQLYLVPRSNEKFAKQIRQIHTKPTGKKITTGTNGKHRSSILLRFVEKKKQGRNRYAISTIAAAVMRKNKTLSNKPSTSSSICSRWVENKPSIRGSRRVFSASGDEPVFAA